MFERGDKLLIVHRRLFEKDTSRFFVGEVQAYEQGVAKVKGYTFVKDRFTGNIKKKRIFAPKFCLSSQGPSLCINCP
jgi:hypothetical protein